MEHLTGSSEDSTLIQDGNCETDGEASVDNQQYLSGSQSRLNTYTASHQHRELEGIATNECDLTLHLKYKI